MNENKEIQKGVIPELIKYVIGLIKMTGEFNPSVIWAEMQKHYPQLKNAERCPNCDANMVQDIYMFDCLDAWLLIEMAKAVRERFKTMVFTPANQTRVHDLPVSYSAKSRTTQLSKLGLITQLQVTKNGKQVSVPGVWVITTMGWKALRGEPVRRRVAVWRGVIQERFTDETITISEAFQLNRDKIDDLVKRNKKAKSDYRFISDEYEPQAWVTFGEITKGVLL